MAKTDTGFIDPGNKGFAIRKLKRGQDGRVYVIFVDAKTGQEVKDPGSFNIIEQGHQIDVTSETPQKEPEKEEDTLTEEMVLKRSNGDGDDSSRRRSKSVISDRNASNNFGYMNSPGALGMAGFMPGPVGLAAKAVGFGVRANNTAAVNDAREMLGMKDKGLFDTAKSLLSDQKGYIGDITHNDGFGSTPVGFEAADKFGRTTLTPEEARRRQALNPSVQEANPQITRQSINSFQEANPQKGLLSGLFNGAKTMFSSLFENTNTQSANSFPDRPNLNAEQVTQNARTAKDATTSGAYRDSKQVRDAIDSGKGGLW